MKFVVLSKFNKIIKMKNLEIAPLNMINYEISKYDYNNNNKISVIPQVEPGESGVYAALSLP